MAPYRHEASIGRFELSGRCRSPIVVAFTRTPQNVFVDLPSDGDRLPASVCVRTARRRFAAGVALSLLAGALAVAGRTTWPG